MDSEIERGSYGDEWVYREKTTWKRKQAATKTPQLTTRRIGKAQPKWKWGSINRLQPSYSRHPRVLLLLLLLLKRQRDIAKPQKTRTL